MTRNEKKLLIIVLERLHAFQVQQKDCSFDLGRDGKLEPLAVAGLAQTIEDATYTLPENRCTNLFAYSHPDYVITRYLMQKIAGELAKK